MSDLGKKSKKSKIFSYSKKACRWQGWREKLLLGLS